MVGTGNGTGNGIGMVHAADIRCITNTSIFVARTLDDSTGRFDSKNASEETKQRRVKSGGHQAVYSMGARSTLNEEDLPVSGA